jgi:tryptophanyl-tRNA synthetase
LGTIKKALALVTTDNGKGIELPSKGSIANLLSFVEIFQGIDARIQYEKAYLDTGIRYGELKENLAKAIYKELKPIQEKRIELENKTDYIDNIIKEGAVKAREIAAKTLAEVIEKMGFIK